MSARKKVEIDFEADKAEIAARAVEDARVLDALVDALAGPDRARRQSAATVLHDVACANARSLVVHGPALADALNRPEVQTRWEVLGVMEELAAVDARVIDRALPQVTECLHDTESSVVRTAAFRVLSAFGATTATRASKVWPLLSDAARIYHGNSEYGAILGGVVRLMEGEAPDDVKKAAVELFEPDIGNPAKAVSRRAKQIVALAPKKRSRAKK